MKPIQVNPDLPRSTPCKIAFVGEAPSDWETSYKRPFVGPSGKIFDAMLKMAGIDRRDCLVTNIFNEQLPDNSVANWCIPTKELPKGYDLPAIDRGKWLDPKYFHHLERLGIELEKYKPTVIVPLGGTALWALTGYPNIMKRRGAVVEATLISPGVKLVPTYHPAFLIHSYHLFPLVVMDLLKARTESRFREIKTTRREIWVEPTLADIKEFRRRYLDSASVISIDIETPFSKKWERTGTPVRYRQIKCIGFASDANHAIVVPFVDERKIDNSYWSDVDGEVEAWREVKEICESAPPKLGQNFGAFDAHWLFDKYRVRVNNLQWDTRLLHHALFPELPKDLGTLGACYANERSWKTMREGVFKRDE